MMLINLVWTYFTFKNNFVIIHNLTKILKGSCEMGSEVHFPFEYLMKIAKNVPEISQSCMLTLMLLVANFANTKLCKKPEKCLKPWQMGTHLKALNESYPMNTNMTGFQCFFQKSLRSCALDESSLSIGRVKAVLRGQNRHEWVNIFSCRSLISILQNKSCSNSSAQARIN